ncbi:PPOX class F420-dependent oxidoreductase [Dactylosporangium sp. CS-047395]|uniref:PPOX class F420-dependent oxidoreductase n=1 Tax=Dactylosporangium sp. CS-047395 TaxID=3239936 RepID=UPI003D8D03A9
MTENEAIAFLAEEPHTGKLATAGPTGDPHVAPIWFIVDGPDIVFSTGRDTVKGHNLRANPRAALTVDVERFPYDFVAVRGGVAIAEEPSDLITWATRIAERYVPAGGAGTYGQLNSQSGNLLCRLRMSRVVGIRDIAAI